MRSQIVTCFWRMSASLFWLWLFGRLFWQQSWLEVLGAAPPWAVILGVLSFVGLAYLIKPDTRASLRRAVLLYIVYLIFWPFLLTLFLTTNLPANKPTSANDFQNLEWSLLPYLLTGFVALGLAFLQFSELIPFYFVWTALAVLVVMTSLITWVASPLRWITGPAEWVSNHLWKQAKKDLSNHENETSNQESLERLSEHYSYLWVVHFIADKFSSQFVVVAFSRKFVWSVLHISVLFGLLHFLIAWWDPTEVTPYVTLADSQGLSGWLDYWSIGWTKLVSGESGVVAQSSAAKVTVLLNSLSGIFLLVVLVTIFSMVSTERAEQSFDNLNSRVVGFLDSIVTRISAAVLSMAQSGKISIELLNGFVDEMPFVNMPKEQAERVWGAVALAELMCQYREIGENGRIDWLREICSTVSENELRALGGMIVGESPDDRAEIVIDFLEDVK